MPPKRKFVGARPNERLQLQLRQRNVSAHIASDDDNDDDDEEALGLETTGNTVQRPALCGRKAIDEQTLLESDTALERCKIAVELLEGTSGGEWFANPVSDEDAPGYSEVVVDPMDLGKIRSQLSQGHYDDDVHSFAKDVRRMYNNAFIYNWAAGNEVCETHLMFECYGSCHFQTSPILDPNAGCRGCQARVGAIREPDAHDRTWQKGTKLATSPEALADEQYGQLCTFKAAEGAGATKGDQA